MESDNDSLYGFIVSEAEENGRENQTARTQKRAPRKQTKKRSSTTKKKRSDREVFMEENEENDESSWQNLDTSVLGEFGRGKPVPLPTAEINTQIDNSEYTNLHEEEVENEEPSTSIQEKVQQKEVVNENNPTTNNKNPVKRLSTIRILKAYEERFSKYFSDELKRELRHLELKSQDTLNELLSEIKYTIYAKTQPDVIKESYYLSIKTYENLIQADGLSDELRKNDRLTELLDEITIKYLHLTHFEPEYRLLYTTLITAQVLRVQNKANNLLHSLLSVNGIPKTSFNDVVTDENILQEYNDL
jgi:hypothetical protein